MWSKEDFQDTTEKDERESQQKNVYTEGTKSIFPSTSRAVSPSIPCNRNYGVTGLLVNSIKNRPNAWIFFFKRFLEISKFKVM